MFAFKVIKAQSKYETTSTYVCQTGIYWFRVAKPKMELDENGNLIIGSGFRWDGPSGSTIDTPDFMRASLVHDALYRMMMSGALPSHRRKKVDDLFHSHLVEDKMPRWRAWYSWAAVRLFGWIPIAWAKRKRR